MTPEGETPSQPTRVLLNTNLMKTIPLSGKKGKGKFVKVSDKDYKRLLHLGPWYLSGKGYAIGGDNGLTTMHRLLVSTDEGREVDHINGDKLDNQRRNLRVVTRSQNMMNGKKYRNTTSVYKGVSYSNWAKKWRVQIGRMYIGDFDNERHAALVYDLWAKDLFGEYARLNF